MNKLIQKLEKIESELAGKSLTSGNFGFDKLTQKTNSVPSVIKIGNIAKNISNKQINFPAFIPFAKSKGICIEVSDFNKDTCHILLQDICLQLIKQLPTDLCKVSLIDTKNLGANFRIIKSLNNSIIGNGIVVDDSSIKHILDENFNRATQIIQDYLTEFRSLSEYNQKSGQFEPYRFIFISNFPYKFTKDNIEKIITLLENSSQAGLYVVLTYDKSISTNNSTEVKQVLSQLTYIKQNTEESPIFEISNIQEKDLYNKLYEFHLENISTNELTSQVSIINKDYQSSNEDKITIGGIKIPIGKVGTQPHNFTFGFDSDNYHAIIGGQSGKGKSVLLNNIIALGIDTYSPNELRFVLCDCKGTEFSEYKSIDENAHIQVFCSSSDVEKGIKVVNFIDDELKRRETIFSEVNAKNIDDYVLKSGKPMPRLICIIDEFQVLFTSTVKNTNYVESILVTKVLRVGRSFGIHLIVCTQSLGDGVRKSFLENIPLRLALGMTNDQSSSFLGMNNLAAGNLPRGKAVYNPTNGDVRANKMVNIDYLSDTDVSQILSNFKAKNIKYQPFEKTKIE
ncbi:MAG: DNA translocase FtsK [Cytophagales bacterium]|nr:MAG: DNA translocase FtsK [Cytophagales bacterium]